jgi:hypothetical protein
LGIPWDAKQKTLLQPLMELLKKLLEGSMKGRMQKNVRNLQISTSKVGGWTHFLAFGQSSTNLN